MNIGSFLSTKATLLVFQIAASVLVFELMITSYILKDATRSYRGWDVRHPLSESDDTGELRNRLY